MRIVQPTGTRGSLKWIQRAVNDRPFVLAHPGLQPVEWLSPLATDGFAEYRDGAFLDRLGLSRLSPALDAFWPKRGPQWDALGIAGNSVVLVEAKAHLDELFSSCKAGDASRRRIEATLNAVRTVLKAGDGADWTQRFYQYANRLAHLWQLRSNGVDARLLLVGFLNDSDVKGPVCAEEWKAAYRMMDYAMGLPRRHVLSAHILHVFPDTREL
ncbi:hypothetical protein IMCC20628_00775 [Hoeflea sp. IMCC20628]|uniref:hypothetical protein n=1 Tax=Hoeflea sp. IMCC20628 TaxID=1620421 RepID=UPI00063AD315|nr:hypothetical protein [Hoeflea sp. IMCC20628]AKH99496.1 hypothetical protein IMCC20628_00775 [Hoeflea sp. IMCC20628]